MKPSFDTENYFWRCATPYWSCLLYTSVADDHDKRVQHLKLTEHALPVIEQLGGIKRKIDQEILEGIPEEDIANMANTMEKIFARFEERAKGKESSL